jgi:hypothetical protein
MTRMTPRIVAGTHGDGPRISLRLGRNGGAGGRVIHGDGPYTSGLRDGGIVHGDGPYIIGLRIMMTDRTEQNRRLLFSFFLLESFFAQNPGERDEQFLEMERKMNKAPTKPLQDPKPSEISNKHNENSEGDGGRLRLEELEGNLHYKT